MGNLKNYLVYCEKCGRICATLKCKSTFSKQTGDEIKHTRLICPTQNIIITLWGVRIIISNGHSIYKQDETIRLEDSFISGIVIERA